MTALQMRAPGAGFATEAFTRQEMIDATDVLDCISI